jgi:hypothetical protein
MHVVPIQAGNWRKRDFGTKVAQSKTRDSRMFFGVAMASITKHGKYWRAQVRRCGYPTQFRTFDTKALAEAWARQLESEMNRGIFKSREEA